MYEAKECFFEFMTVALLHCKFMPEKEDEFLKIPSWNSDRRITCLVLILEDSDTDSKLISEMLSYSDKYEYKTAVVESVSDALAQLESQPFDIILLDLNVMDSSGAKTFYAIQMRYPEVPIVIITAFGEEDKEVEKVKMEADGFITKGRITPSRLIGAIAHALESRERKDEEIQKGHVLREEVQSIKRDFGIKDRG